MIFLPNIYIVSYTDYNTPYTMSKSTGEVLRDTWFLNKNTKANPFYLLLDDTDC